MKIKICGITSLDDAIIAIDAGVDMLGFNFYPKSPRYISPEASAEIQPSIRKHKPSIVCVGVFVNTSPKEVLSSLERTGLQLAQLSGDEPLSDLVALKGRAFKAVRLSAGQRESMPSPSVDYARVRAGHLPALLMDAAVKGEYGGTGMTADWVAAADLAHQAPLLLAGGLTPENVAAAVRQVHPWGVDVASGVESSPGKKDAVKVRQFIQNARDAFWESIQIILVSKTDLPEILALQKLAYQSEAELNNDFTIPPLKQTLSELEDEFSDKLILKAVMDGNIVGSVRGVLQEDTCHVGRVIVHPHWQNFGIGNRLMEAIERRFGSAKRYELFTSEHSARNLYLYQKLGYRIFDHKKLDEHVSLIYLEKKA